MRDDGNGASGAVRQARDGLRREKDRGNAVDVVHEAEAIWTDQSEPAGARDCADAVLLADAIAADFGEAGREDHRGPYLAPHAPLDRFAHGGCRQCDNGEIHVLRKFIDVRKNLAAVDVGGGAADDMNGAGELVVVQKFQDHTTGRTRLGGHADDGDAARTHHGTDGGCRYARTVGRNVRCHCWVISPRLLELPT